MFEPGYPVLVEACLCGKRIVAQEAREDEQSGLVFEGDVVRSSEGSNRTIVSHNSFGDNGCTVSGLKMGQRVSSVHEDSQIVVSCVTKVDFWSRIGLGLHGNG